MRFASQSTIPIRLMNSIFVQLQFQAISFFFCFGIFLMLFSPFLKNYFPDYFALLFLCLFSCLFLLCFFSLPSVRPSFHPLRVQLLAWTANSAVLPAVFVSRPVKNATASSTVQTATTKSIVPQLPRQVFLFSLALGIIFSSWVLSNCPSCYGPFSSY